MTWEETIQFIRTKPEYSDLVKFTYLEEDLVLNVDRFYNSEEYKATKKLLGQYQQNFSPVIVDIGAGNGIASIAFALDNYNVIAVEPDPSNTVGTGAITALARHYNLSNVNIIACYAEKLPLESESVDIVYCRQAMHHAYHLNDFVAECSRILKKEGVLLTTRDHVVDDDDVQKEAFLKIHPLQSFYGGENAFSVTAYKKAMEAAGLKVVKTIAPYESVINRAPVEDKEFYNKLGLFSKNSIARTLYNQLFNLKNKKRPGRLYSFLSIKNS